MDARAVAVVGLVVGPSERQVQAAADLLVVEGVLHGLVDARVDPQGELAQVAGALVGVEQALEPLLLVGLGLDDLAVLEGQLDALEGDAVFERRGVEGDGAVDRVAHRSREDLAVGDVVLTRRLEDGDALDGEGEVGARRR